MSSEIGMILMQLPCHFSVLKNIFFSSFPLILPGSYHKLLQCNLGGVGEPDPLCTVNSVNESQTFPGFATFALRQDSAPIHGAESSHTSSKFMGTCLGWTGRKAHVGERVVRTSGTCSRNRSSRCGDDAETWGRGRGRFPGDVRGDDESEPNAPRRAGCAGTLVEGSQAGRTLGTAWGLCSGGAASSHCGLGKTAAPSGGWCASCAHSLGSGPP